MVNFHRADFNLYNLGHQEELEAHIHRLSCVGIVLKRNVTDFGLRSSLERNLDRNFRNRFFSDQTQKCELADQPSHENEVKSRQ